MFEKPTKLIKFLYSHNLIRYLYVGGTTFVIDIGLLIFLHGKLKINLAVATSVSYWVSIIYNFILNRWWTFNAKDNNKLRKHLAAYSALLAINYLFTIIFVSFVSHFVNYAYAKIMAVILQTAWTYRIYKNIIFKD